MQNFIQSPNFSGSIGLGIADVTPEIGIYSKNWGASTKCMLSKHHTPIMVHAVTFRQHQQLFILVTLDLVTFPNVEEFAPKGLLPFLSNKFNTPESHIILHCTHTHSGPTVDVNRSTEPGGDKILPYLKLLKLKIIEAIEKAIASERNSILEWEAGESPLATNRDLIKNDRVVVGFNPEIKPDQTLLLGRATDSTGKLFFTMVHYACHPTTLAWDNEHFSSDYVGVMRITIEKETGSPCVFLLGNAGDQAPRNQYKGDVAWAEKNGRIVAYSALSVLEAMNAPKKQLNYSKIIESGAPLALWDQELYESNTFTEGVQLPLKLKVKSTYPKLAQLLDQKAKCKEHFLLERINRSITIRKTIGDGDEISNPVWVWQLGRTFFVALPNEAYSFLQKSLRADFPGYAILPLNLCNGSQSYLPHAAQYDRLDTYAVWVALFERGSLELIYEETKKKINELIRKDVACQAQS